MAQNLELALVLKAKVDEFTRAVQQASGDLSSALSRMEAEGKGAGAGVEAATSGMERGLEGAAATAKDAGTTFEQALSKLELRQRKDIEADIAAVRQAYETLARSGKLSGEELAQANVTAREAIASLKRESNDWVGSLGRMKTELAVAGAALYGLQRTVTSAAKASSGFAEAMAEVSTLLDDTSGMDGLTRSVEQLSLQFGSDVKEQAKALYQIISAGASDAAHATEILTTANELAVGGVTDVKTAADGLTSILNAYGERAGSAKDVSDALFVAMKAGKTTIGELSGSIGQVAPLAAQAGAGLEELLAAVAALTKGGVSTSEAMTQMRGVMAAVVKPTAEATKLAKELGIEFSAAALKSKGLAGFLQEVAEKTGGNTEVMARLFGRVEALGATLALTGNQAESFGEILEGMGDKAGQTGEAFAKMADSPVMASRRFAQAMAAVQRSLGDAVTALSPLLEGVGNLVGAFNALPGPLKSSALAAGALGTAAAVVAKPLANLAATARLASEALKAKGTAVAALVPTLGQGASATLGFVGSLGRLLPVLGLAAAAIWGAVEAGKWLGDTLGGLSAAAREAAAAQERLNDAAADWAGFAKAQVILLEDYQDAVRLTSDQVALLTEAEKAQYAERLDGLQKLQRMQLSAAEAEEALGRDTKTRQEQIRAELTQTKQAFLDLEAGTRFAAEAMARGVSPQAAQLGEALAALTVQGKTAAEAVQILGLPFDPGSLESVRTLGQALEEARRLGALSAEGVRQAWAAALEKLSTEDLDRFVTTVRASFGEAKADADALTAALSTGVEAALKKLGVDAREVTEGLTAAGVQARTAFELVAREITATGASAEDAGKIIAASFDAALKKATSTEDLEALRRAVVRVGAEGGPAAGALGDALAELDAKAKKLAAEGATEAAAAVSKLGAEAKKAAGGVQETGAALEDLGAQGEAGAARTGRGLGLVSAEAAAARESVEALGESATQAYDAVLTAGGRTTASLSEIKTAAAGITVEYSRQAQAVDALAARLRTAEGATLGNVAAAEEALREFRLLGDERLAPLRDALADARRRTVDLRDDARSTLASLRDELDQMNRDYAAVEKRRYETRKLDLEGKLDEARRANDTQAQKDLQESLRVLDQVHKQKLAQLEAERRAEAARHAEAADNRRREAAEAQTRRGAEERTGAVATARRETEERTGTARELAPSPSRTVRIEFGAGGPAGTFDERDADALLRLLESQGARSL